MSVWTTGPISDAAFEAVFRLLADSFPPSEYREKAGQRALLSRPGYEVWRYERDGELCALIALWRLDGFTFIEHLAVAPLLRGGGLGGRLLAGMLAQAGEPIFLEVELPDNDMARRRVGFYRRLGCQLNEYDYEQPALRPGGSPVPMRAMTYPATVDAATFAHYRSEVYRAVYGIEL